MTRLLYIESSPRKDRSASIEIAHAYLEGWRAAHPDGTVDTLDVWAEELPEVDGDALEAKYAGIAGEERTEAQQREWDRFTALAQRFRDADALLIGVPMWNYSIPYRLKHLIDVVTHADLLFELAEGVNPGLLDVPAVVVYTRGQPYGPESPTPAAEWDAQKPTIDIWLRSIGVTDVTDVIAESTIGAADLGGAVERARALGRG